MGRALDSVRPRQCQLGGGCDSTELLEVVADVGQESFQHGNLSRVEQVAEPMVHGKQVHDFENALTLGCSQNIRVASQGNTIT